MTSARVIRLSVRSLAALFVAALLVYPADWAIWRLRMARGAGMDQVEVTNITAAELKGNKEEFYPEGLSTLDCSRSLFRQAGAGACWYLRKHPETITRY